MYAGEVVERGKTADVLGNPQHPYTKALLASVPHVDDDKPELVGIPGHPPRMDAVLQGCTFRDRCQMAHERCQIQPTLVDRGGHAVRCWLMESGE